jgi:hypothetical protein
MVNLYLLSVIPILLTDYGFQSSKKVIQGLTPRFSLRRTGLRFLFWFLVACLTLQEFDSDLILPVFSFFMIGEVCSLALRFTIRSDTKHGLHFGSVKTHLIPFIFPGVLVPAIYLLWTLILRGNGITIELGKALTAELLSPGVIVQTKALLVSIVFISQWAWASIVTRAIQFDARLFIREEVLDPRSARSEIVGILERLITLLLVSIGGHVGAGIVIAIKSTSRLPKLIDRQDADQFVIETLSSIGLATLGGFLIMTI